MRLFIYYAFHTVINTLRKLLKTWVAIILVIAVAATIFGILVGRLVPLVEKSIKGEDAHIEETVEEVTEEEGEAKESKFSIFLSENNLTTFDVVDLVVTAAFLFIVTICLASVNRGGEIFKPADVPLLFASPMKPQSVLMFRLMNSLGMNIFIGFYMIFQIPNIVKNLHVSIWSAFTMLLAYILALVFSTLLQVAFYTFSRNSKSGKINIGAILIGFYALLAAAFFAYTTITKQSVIVSAFTFFGNKHTFWIPFLGWIRGMVYFSVTGETAKSLLYMGLFIVFSILTIVLIWNIKADFYEDAMYATERVAAKIENSKAASRGGTVTREKNRSDKLERDGFKYGSGAGVFFFKAVYNRLRFATFRIFSKTFCVNLLAALVCGWLGSRIHNAMIDPFLIPAAVIMIIAFYRTLGNPLEEDTSREFFILIPEPPLKKIWASLLGSITVCAIDMSIPMIAAAVFTHANPGTVAAWFIYILTVSLFGTAVGAFVSLSIPGDHAQTIKMTLQVMFVYFGILPSAGFVIFGMIMQNVGIMLIAGSVFNLVLGGFFTLITPKFLTNR